MPVQKNIAEYLHYYIGKTANVRAGEDWSKNPMLIDFELMASAYTGIYDEVKPILRKLSSMTEDEMIGLLMATVPHDMEDKPTAEDYNVELFHNDGGLLVDSDVAIGADYSCRCYEGQIAIRQNGDIDLFGEDGEKERVVNYPQAFHYLISKGFDLFGLIESGLAVNEKKEG